MTLIVDASVAVKWFFEESGHEVARALLDQGEEIISPSLVLAEISNAVWKRRRRNEIKHDAAHNVIQLIRQPFSELVPIEELALEAAAVSLNFDHPVYDCFYVALAGREHVPLATADLRMAALAEYAGVALRWVGRE